MVLGSQVGSQNRRKIDLKRHRKNDEKRLQLERFWGVEVGCKNRSNIYQKMESKMECLLASIFDGLFINFGGLLEARWDGTSIVDGILNDFRTEGGSKLAPASNEKTMLTS